MRCNLKTILRVSAYCFFILVSRLQGIDRILFNNTWNTMQQEYTGLLQVLNKSGYVQLEKDYYHTHWMNAKDHVRSLITGVPNTVFLKDKVIASTMVPGGMGAVQQYEISLIQDCTSPQVRDSILHYEEPDIGPSQRSCSAFNCSTNCLNKLSYAAKVLSITKKTNVIVEFGGGYGCLAHILKRMLPQSTIILIDIPEFLALQYLYLRYGLPSETIVIHRSIPQEFIKGAIHLVPTHYIRELAIDADVFISTFALSESPICMQAIIGEKKFFNAKTCYITGQLYGWNGMFEDHNVLLDTIRRSYSNTLCIPFYYTLNTVKSYELVAINS